MKIRPFNHLREPEPQTVASWADCAVVIACAMVIVAVLFGWLA